MSILIIGTNNPVTQVSSLLYYAFNRSFDIIVSNADSWSTLTQEDRELAAKHCMHNNAELYLAGIKADTTIVVGSTNSRRVVTPTIFTDKKSDTKDARPGDFAIFQFIERFYNDAFFVVNDSAKAQKLRDANKLVSRSASPQFFLEPPSTANCPIIAIGFGNDAMPTRYINADLFGLTVDSFL